MHVAVLALVFLLQTQSTEEKIRAIVAKLDSDEIVERDGAARELARIGSKALPALRESAARAKADTKALVEQLINQISARGAPVSVTIEGTGRPLREIAAELERQTLIPIRLLGSAAETKATVTVKDTPVWKVVEELCRSRGDLMYRFIDDAIEIYPSPFRTLPSVDAHGMRFFIDRFILDGAMVKERHEGFIREHVAVLVPRGSRVVWIGYKVDDMTDDKGNNLVKEPERGGFGGPLMPLEPDGFQTLPTSRKFLYPFYIHRSNQRPPAEGCAKIARLRGKIEVVIAEGLQRIASIPNPLSRPSTLANEDLPSLGISRWKVVDGVLNMRYTAAWNGDAENGLWYRLKPLLVLNEKSGEWQVSPRWYSRSRLSPKEVERRDNVVSFTWPQGSTAVSLDLVGPHPVVKHEIPFDFKDIPLR